MIPRSLTGDRVCLRPVERGDYALFHAWRSDLEHLHLWSAQRRIATFEELTQELEGVIRTMNTLSVAELETNAAVGFVQAFGMDIVDRYAHLRMYIEPSRQHLGYGLEAGLLFTRHMFYNYGLRKLYAEVFEHNSTTLKWLERIGFVEEGRLRQHTWYRDRYWDMVVLALYREAWDVRNSRWNQLLGIREDAEQLVAVHRARASERAPS